MRIVGGLWRGRKLLDLSRKPQIQGLRPTLDKVKETIFNILIHGLGFEVNDSRVLDLFCGTGALGFEALSRGAKHACFVDIEKSALNIVKENQFIFKAQKQSTLLHRDATKLRLNTTQDYDLIFLDPPYGKGLGELALSFALDRNWICKKAIVVWEERGTILPPEGLSLIRTRPIGNSCLNFLTRCN